LPGNRAPHFTSQHIDTHEWASLGTPMGDVTPDGISLMLDNGESAPQTVTGRLPERSDTTIGYQPPPGDPGQLSIVPDIKKLDLVRALIGNGGAGIKVTGAHLDYNTKIIDPTHTAMSS